MAGKGFRRRNVKSPRRPLTRVGRAAPRFKDEPAQRQEGIVQRCERTRSSLFRIAEPHHLKRTVIATQPKMQTVFLDAAVGCSAAAARALAAQTPASRIQGHLELSVQFRAG